MNSIQKVVFLVVASLFVFECIDAKNLDETKLDEKRILQNVTAWFGKHVGDKIKNPLFWIPTLIGGIGGAYFAHQEGLFSGSNEKRIISNVTKWFGTHVGDKIKNPLFWIPTIIGGLGTAYVIHQNGDLTIPEIELPEFGK